MTISYNNFVRLLIYGGLVILLLAEYSPALLGSDEFNGFDVSNSLIPADEIHQGGPPRDGIPAIDQPRFVKAADASHVKSDEIVLGIEFNGEARAYPISILNWHEIINDRIQAQSVVVSFCPLCGTGMVYLVDEREGYGVSGLLYNSDMLLYDRATESLWSQIKSQAISGSRKGEELNRLPVSHMKWSAWASEYPDSLVLSRDTGHQRDYDKSPYLGYSSSERLYFPVNNRDNRYTNKESVIGLVRNGQSRVWPVSEIRKCDSPIRDHFNGEPVTINFDETADHARITDKQGKLLDAIRAYWFAWIAFYPDSELYQCDQE
ncbi:DUF3179 domain-containing protein [Solemya velum gill symbiont]|uniref:DUF3179 domain-containing protein n=1 Tax=Solemya velum gill symbiont TaxID=2340 RepID=UPI00099650B0|nr:DUF3179 domain-containing protein [Solemya velum gill symbiont]